MYEVEGYPKIQGETWSDYHDRVTREENDRWHESIRRHGQDWRPFTESDAWRDIDPGPRAMDGGPRYIDV